MNASPTRSSNINIFGRRERGLHLRMHLTNKTKYQPIALTTLMILIGAFWVHCCSSLVLLGEARPLNVAFALLIFILVFMAYAR
jgi:hypothetical protein